MTVDEGYEIMRGRARFAEGDAGERLSRQKGYSHGIAPPDPSSPLRDLKNQDEKREDDQTVTVLREVRSI
jgi:hypothetical protein